MISSAVVIPEPPRETSSPPRTFKRKLSQSPSRDSKRPRVDVDELQYDEPPSRPTPPSEPSRSTIHVSYNNTTPASPPRRKSSLLSGTTATEEKKRNKRLFGSLLGTLSQTTTKPAHKRRDEIEARQRERMRQQTEEEEERRNQRKREIDQRRREQQKLWDEEAMRQRHRNMRDMAGFLRTKTEPRLYYKPWELRMEEEQDIVRQKEDVEQVIRKELGEDDEDMDDGPVTARQDEVGDQSEQQDSMDQPLSNGEHPQQNHPTPGKENITNGHDNDYGNSMETESQLLPESTAADGQNSDQEAPATNGNTHEDQAQPIHDEDHQKEEDAHGEELVEGQEDDVIY